MFRLNEHLLIIVGFFLIPSRYWNEVVKQKT
jgi:hypothetical protein